MKDKIKKIFEKDGFEVSNQAIAIISKLDKAEENTKEIIKLLKQRKIMITGGDVMYYIGTGRLPGSPIISEDRK